MAGLSKSFPATEACAGVSSAAPLVRRLGRVGGFNQDQSAGNADHCGVADIGLVAAHCDSLEPLQLADRLFDAGAELIEAFGEKRFLCLEFSRRGITGVM